MSIRFVKLWIIIIIIVVISIALFDQGILSDSFLLIFTKVFFVSFIGTVIIKMGD